MGTQILIPIKKRRTRHRHKIKEKKKAPLTEKKTKHVEFEKKVIYAFY